MTQQWFYTTPDNQRIGPVSFDDLCALRASGAISRNTCVWTPGMKEWSPYRRVFRKRLPLFIVGQIALAFIILVTITYGALQSFRANIPEVLSVPSVPSVSLEMPELPRPSDPVDYAARPYRVPRTINAPEIDECWIAINASSAGDTQILPSLASAKATLDAATNGNTDAMIALSYLSYRGLGIPRDLDTAMHWMTRAGNSGCSFAQSFLAGLFARPGTREYDELAYQWASIIKEPDNDDLRLRRQLAQRLGK